MSKYAVGQRHQRSGAELSLISGFHLGDVMLSATRDRE